MCVNFWQSVDDSAAPVLWRNQCWFGEADNNLLCCRRATTKPYSLRVCTCTVWNSSKVSKTYQTCGSVSHAERICVFKDFVHCCFRLVQGVAHAHTAFPSHNQTKVYAWRRNSKFQAHYLDPSCTKGIIWDSPESYKRNDYGQDASYQVIIILFALLFWYPFHVDHFGTRRAQWVFYISLFIKVLSAVLCSMQYL